MGLIARRVLEGSDVAMNKIIETPYTKYYTTSSRALKYTVGIDKTATAGVDFHLSVVRGHFNQASNVPTAEAVLLAMYLVMVTIVFSSFNARLARHGQHQTNNAD